MRYLSRGKVTSKALIYWPRWGLVAIRVANSANVSVGFRPCVLGPVPVKGFRMEASIAEQSTLAFSGVGSRDHAERTDICIPVLVLVVVLDLTRYTDDSTQDLKRNVMG